MRTGGGRERILRTSASWYFFYCFSMLCRRFLCVMTIKVYIVINLIPFPPQSIYNMGCHYGLHWGHPFMTSTKNKVFDPPPPVHMGWTPPPCGRPQAVVMKYTPLS